MKETKFENTIIFSVVYLTFVLTVILGAWVVKSYLEAKSFNRLTGAEATTWDAMFLQLRVQEPVTRKQSAGVENEN